jgi:hypothetical protein
MYLKKLFDPRVISLLVIFLLYAGVQTARSQDADKIWQDSSTGLSWAVEDSGSDMNWNQANAYCEGLSLGGHKGWRLATIQELEGLYDRNLKKEYKVKGPIKLESATVWSGSKNNLGDSWSFNFGFGGSSISSGGGGSCGTVGRALCTYKAEGK